MSSNILPKYMICVSQKGYKVTSDMYQKSLSHSDVLNPAKNVVNMPFAIEKFNSIQSM